jgi:hypothetical protein
MPRSRTNLSPGWIAFMDLSQRNPPSPTSGTATIAQGGTGQITAGAALTALGGLSTTTASSTYLPLTGGTLSGALNVSNSVATTGSSSGYTFEPRDAPGQVWLVYAAAGTLRLWKSTDALILDPSGNLTVMGATATKPGGGSWVAPSDSRLKRGITEYTSGLEQVLALRPITYQYTGAGGMPDDGVSYVGLDAGDTEKVMPEMVGSMMVTLDPKNESDMPQPPDTEIKTIDNTALVYALVNSCKELAARVAMLEDMLAADGR